MSAKSRPMVELTPDQIDRFNEEGFLILDRFLDPGLVAHARARFEPLFRGEFETGLYPDEWNWQEGRDPPDLTRQICNGWRSDRTVAAIVLAEEVGRACARLMGWPGARIAQDNVIWKPPGAKPLGFHHGRTWHGSDRNRADRPRRSLVAHCVSFDARFNPTEISYVYSRYKRVGDDAMDESFFPVLWTEDGRRTGWLDGYARAAA
jgi:hypothetical protein